MGLLGLVSAIARSNWCGFCEHSLARPTGQRLVSCMRNVETVVFVAVDSPNINRFLGLPVRQFPALVAAVMGGFFDVVYTADI